MHGTDENRRAHQTLQDWVEKAHKLVFFGGAGVSTESDIPDFRSVDGLYRQRYDYPPEEILSHEFFLRHTEAFFAFYRDRMLYPNARPNAAHRALAQWEAQGRLALVVTQNIDGLHQAAGSRKVVELHGSVHRNTCMRCGKTYDLASVLQSKGVPRCACGGVIKPDVVLYGESLNQNDLTRAVQAIAQADVLIVAGTSLAVYPAAGLIDAYRGQQLVLINRDATPADGRADLLLHENVAQVLGALHVDA